MKLVIFDCDGTLVDSQHIIVAAMTQAFDAQALAPPPREQILSIVGLSLHDAMAALTPEHEPSVHHRLADAYKKAFWSLRAAGDHPEELFEGARGLLERLRARDDVLLGIATGKSRRGADYIVERHGWAELFKTVQTADDAISKPHPEMILRAIAETGARPERTLMVGDSTFDMEMAVAAGVTPVAVSWGFQPVAALQAAGARHVIESCAELTGIVDRLAMAEPA